MCLNCDASVSLFGRGKSSLLNALLDEAAVLPTSGSRGCTAAVVELVYNHELLGDAEETEPQGNPIPKEVPVYRGEVEFMKKEDCR
jgi:Dynamin family